jgi:hypothetical protein
MVALTQSKVRQVDSYSFLAAFGKRVIHSRKRSPWPSGPAPSCCGGRADDPCGLLADEGSQVLAVIAQEMSWPAYLRKMAWLWSRKPGAVPYLGYLLVMVRKPESSTLGKA